MDSRPCRVVSWTSTVVFALFASSVPCAAQQKPERGGILVVAPHPDDDIIMAAGVVQRAHQRQVPVRVVYVTNGDANGQELGAVRQAEAVAGQKRLGTPELQLVFLGYPDGALAAIRSNHRSAASRLTSEHGRSATAASRGLGGSDYHSYRFGAPGAYNWPGMVGDLADLLASSRPAHIFTTSQWDTHSDHSTTYELVIEAVKRASATASDYNPTIHKTTVWPGVESWPAPADSASYFTEIPRQAVLDPRDMIWKERESLDVPAAMQSGSTPANPKYTAVGEHQSQGGVDRYIGRWIHKDEFFWTEQVVGANRPPVPNAGPDQQVAGGAAVTLDGQASWDRNGGGIAHRWRQVAGPQVVLSDPTGARPTFTAPHGLTQEVALEFELVVSDRSLESVPDGVRIIVGSAAPPVAYGRNAAPLAAISASSERDTAQGAPKVADGVVDGYPGDGSREWVTAGEKKGAWIELSWRSPIVIGKIAVADRPNSADQLIAGTIEFSDGSTLPVGPLSNEGRLVWSTFAPRTVRSLRLTVNEVSRATENIGLAELQVYETAGASGGDARQERPAAVPRGTPVAPTPGATERPPSATSTSTGPIASAPAVVEPGNIAPAAAVRASSERAPTQAARKAVDGVLTGYPSAPDHEWATTAETAGAWIELSWTSPRRIGRVRLHDRPNLDDQVRSGTLTFSDGTSVPVGVLGNDGAPVDVDVSPRSVRWVRFTIDAVGGSTANVGLAEILVFEAAPGGVK